MLYRAQNREPLTEVRRRAAKEGHLSLELVQAHLVEGEAARRLASTSHPASAARRRPASLRWELARTPDRLCGRTHPPKLQYGGTHHWSQWAAKSATCQLSVIEPRGVLNLPPRQRISAKDDCVLPQSRSGVRAGSPRREAGRLLAAEAGWDADANLRAASLSTRCAWTNSRDDHVPI